MGSPGLELGFPEARTGFSVNLLNASSNCFSSGGITRLRRSIAAVEFCIAR